MNSLCLSTRLSIVVMAFVSPSRHRRLSCRMTAEESCPSARAQGRTPFLPKRFQFYDAVPVMFVPFFVIVYSMMAPLQKWNFRITVPSFTSLKKLCVRVISFVA